ncbi:MAG: hypothetical protein EBS72_16090, partial [Rhizobiales bacterium]|nr:hypothetical protein [Hyphomicrobiales bacterium]
LRGGLGSDVILGDNGYIWRASNLAVSRVETSDPANGGNGQFISLPPFGDDGHRSFIGNSKAWTAPVLQFLRQNGFTAPEQ